MLERSGQPITYVENFYKTYKDDSFRSPRSLESLLLCLITVSNAFKDVFILVDGLDECQRRRDLLLEIFNRFSNKHFHVLVTSRPDPDIKQAFSTKSSFPMDTVAVTQDIMVHIDASLNEDTKLKKLRPQMKERIRKDLTEKCDGM